jgi:hypothetical protein
MNKAEFFYFPAIQDSQTDIHHRRTLFGRETYWIDRYTGQTDILGNHFFSKTDIPTDKQTQ